ncbi:MAG: 16S rRNA (uracil(1498)-N(3))-methyltransferase [Muribaculaceae bacterium]|nr:16S rRNA (uracil(1498)-N(3))-methyltransferase [Muribaculaceae bacterium]MBQ7212831.1 16S rRNA (uracil(1498)-N(3))-methyltransferase [Muribaculaceae bacterium]
MIQFYAPEISSTLTLPESDSTHCVRVLRMRCGDVVEIVDGKGHRFRCRITDANPKRTTVEIVEVTNIKKAWDNSITIAIAPTKHIDRMEWAVEKLVEIGVDRIVPLLCCHSERKEIKVERLEKIAVAAMKQSLKATLPQIDPMTPIASFLQESVSMANVQKFVGYCDDNTPRRLLAASYHHGCDAVVLIGPEGDFTHDEIENAFDAGFSAVTLGDNRLRTETAAIVACDTIHIINQAFADK